MRVVPLRCPSLPPPLFLSHSLLFFPSLCLLISVSPFISLSSFGMILETFIKNIDLPIKVALSNLAYSFYYSISFFFPSFISFYFYYSISFFFPSFISSYFCYSISFFSPSFISFYFYYSISFFCPSFISSYFCYSISFFCPSFISFYFSFSYLPSQYLNHCFPIRRIEQTL